MSVYLVWVCIYIYGMSVYLYIYSMCVYLYLLHTSIYTHTYAYELYICVLFIYIYMCSIYLYLLHTSIYTHTYAHEFMHCVHTYIHTHTYQHHQRSSRMRRLAQRDMESERLARYKIKIVVVCIGRFPQKSPVISGSFADHDLQLTASYESLLYGKI